MSRTIQDEPLRPGETETDRVARFERNMPGGSAKVENDPDPMNEEGDVDRDTSDPADLEDNVGRTEGSRAI